MPWNIMGAKYDFSFASFFRRCVSRHLLENSKYFFKDILILCFYVNLIQDESFWDCLRMEGGQKGRFSNLWHISCNDETWQSYSLPKKPPKITWHTPWILPTSAFFHRRSVNFAISRNTDIDCVLVHNS